MPGSFQTSNPGGVSSTGALPGVRSFTSSTPLAGTAREVAFAAKMGEFAADTLHTVQSVTALGFRPKALILFMTSRATDSTGAAQSCSNSYGYSDGVHQGWVGVGANTAVATSNVGRDLSTTRIIGTISDGTPTVANEATLTSLDADGFTITWDITPPTARLVGYMAIGGSDITNVFVGNSTLLTTTGNKSIVDVGFQGNFALLLAAKNTVAGTGTGASLTMGAAVSSSKQWTYSLNVADGQTVSASVDGMSVFYNNACLSGLTTTATIDYVADFTQFTSSGFDLNFSNGSPSADIFLYLVIKGGQWDAGTSAKPTTATTQTVTGESFQPQLLGLATSSGVTSSSIITTATSCFGGATSLNQNATGWYHNDAINTDAWQSMSSSLSVAIPQPTVNASFTSFNSDGWTMTWGQTGAANLVGWFTAAANAIVVAGPSVSGNNTLMLLGVGI